MHWRHHSFDARAHGDMIAEFDDGIQTAGGEIRQARPAGICSRQRQCCTIHLCEIMISKKKAAKKVVRIIDLISQRKKKINQLDGGLL